MAIERIAIDPMKDRAAWLQLRAGFITASDVPAVCGFGLYHSAARVWAEKRGLLAQADMNDAMLRGIIGEPAVFRAIEWHYPDWELKQAKVFLADRAARLGATPDGAAIVPDRPGIVVVQCKVIAAPVFRADWLADPDDDLQFGAATPPLAYRLQTLTETMLAEASSGVLAVLVVDAFKWVLRLFWVERHPGSEAAIRDKVATFWRDYLDPGVQPPIDGRLDEDLVKRLFPQDDGTEIDLTGDNEMPALVDGLIAARGDKKDAEGREKEAKTIIAAKIGEASFARIADGRRVSNKVQHRAAYEVKPTSFRILKVMAS
jgi:hypothetical protein